MRRLIMWTATAAIFGLSNAHAAELLTSHFAGLNGARICYARAYDANHLKTHPRQKVRRVEIDFDRKNPDGKTNTSPDHFELGFGAQLRGSTEWFAGNAICAMKGAAASCYLEADGGRFTLTASGKSLRMDVDRDGLRFEGEKDGVEFAGNLSDDNSFILPPAARALCDASTAKAR